ncbi:MAG: hypothetical protein KU38_05495 [Sulfurovum sp. FS08-3]|nr:MAG: hypothetical protein KU38_05495 [Sulfurovum sp. FS08-3]
MLRFVVSSADEMHLENLRTAIFSYILALQKGEGFMLYIDERCLNDEAIFMLLEKFALPHEQRLYQNERKHIHQALARRLFEEKKAFVDDSKEVSTQELQASFELRLHKPDVAPVLNDLIAGAITASPKEIDNFVILQTHAIPTTDFACACDDMLNGITSIITTYGDLTKSIKGHHIQEILGYTQPITYWHLPPIDGGNTTLEGLLKEGFLPDAIINYVIALGYPTPVEIFTLPDAIEWFDPTKLSRDSVRLDWDRLRFINREHLRRMEDKRLSTLFGFADSDIGKLAKLYLEKVSTINELEVKIKAIFAPKRCTGNAKLVQEIILQAPMLYTFETFVGYLKKESKLEEMALKEALQTLFCEQDIEPSLIYPFIKSYITEVVA